MLRQNQIGTIATPNISTIPAANRFICGSAQRDGSPPATEYSIRKPKDAAAVRRTTSGQFR